MDRIYFSFVASAIFLITDFANGDQNVFMFKNVAKIKEGEVYIIYNNIVYFYSYLKKIIELKHDNDSAYFL